MARGGYDNRRSQATVFVNSSFILKEFKRNISKGFYGDKELERLTRKLVMELWRRDPALLEDIAKLTANKYGNYVRKEYGTLNFRKKLVEDYNQKKMLKFKAENDVLIKQMSDDINNSIDATTMFDNIDNDELDKI